MNVEQPAGDEFYENQDKELRYAVYNVMRQMVILISEMNNFLGGAVFSQSECIYCFRLKIPDEITKTMETLPKRLQPNKLLPMVRLTLIHIP